MSVVFARPRHFPQTTNPEVSGKDGGPEFAVSTGTPHGAIPQTPQPVGAAFWGGANCFGVFDLWYFRAETIPQATTTVKP